MRLVLKPHPNWTAQDQALTTQFFHTDTWAKLMESVMAARPPTSGDKLEQRAIGGIQREQVEDTVNAFAQVLVWNRQPTDPDSSFTQIDVSKGVGTRQ